MGIVFRQSVKSLLAVGTGAALGAAINLVGPHFLEKSQLGLSRNIVNQAAVLQFLALLGANNTLVTFLPRYGHGDIRYRRLLGFAFAFPLAAVGVLAILFALFRDAVVGLYQAGDQPLVRHYLWLLPVLTGLSCALSLFDAILIGEKKTALMLFNKEVLLRVLNLGLIVATGLSWISFHGFMVSHILLFAVPVTVGATVAWRTGRYRPAFSGSLPQETRREWLHFAWYHLLTGVSLNLTGFIDSLLLPALDPNGFESLAVYSIALFVAAILYIPYKAMSVAAFPVLNEAWIANDMPRVRNLFSRTGLNILLVSVPLLLLIAANLPLLEYLLPRRYNGMAPLVLILLVGRFADVASGMNGDLLSLSSRYKFAFRLSGGLVLALIGLNALLIPRLGAAGAAWSASLALLAFNGVKMAYLHRHYGITPLDRPTAKVLLAGALAGLVFLIPAPSHPVVNGFVRSALLCGIYAVAVYRLSPSPDLNAYLQSVLKNRRLF